MQPVFVFIIIGVILLGYLYVGDFFKPEEAINLEKTSSQVFSQEATLQKTDKNLRLESRKPAILIDTQITSGPENDEIIDGTNEVTFEFKGMVPANLQREISFDTKVEGLDANWINNISDKRVITFSAGAQKYTFSVRTKVNGIVDATPAKRTFKVSLSPYFGKVKISGISQSSITLTNNLAQGEKINITNWRVKGMRGEIIIPQGTELYLSNYPLLKNDIFIKQYDTVYISSDYSPFGINKNFRPNKCFGYLKDYYTSNFPFSFSKICPQINCEEIRYFSESCQSAIRQLQNCFSLNYSNYPQISFDSSCQAYLENYTAKYLNYDGCIQNYSKDKDFFQNTWYIYAGYSIFCKCSDNLYLYDQNGLLADKYHYESY